MALREMPLLLKDSDSCTDRKTSGKDKIGSSKQPETRPDRVLIDKRRQPRFKLEVKIVVNSRTRGLLRVTRLTSANRESQPY